MKAVIVTFFALLALTAAAPSGLGLGLGLGLGGPALLGGPLLGGAGVLGLPAIAAPIAPIAPIVAPVGAAAITNGGGLVGVSGAGAVVRGPPTAPVLIEGPPGTGAIAAKGLWGPTLAGVAH